ncbi:bL17 family ribosomal protein [Fuerstiella marisgermanici]|uniref:Large ribosomal subunit protein bL17 n=1 Tax=Fuerstiella marisgermanici TaxID=1891926 RepID=A0A1P8WQ82_9PLAN|nr:bL17 family ribosomal protein [Fuerstiella marisgermanici]APZ96209.1 50S ribosomal protein L17 [Fuerstiella marisgermanici]
MRHRVSGRKLGRNASHRKAMFRNMAASLIKTVRIDEDDPQRPKVAGRIVTTVPKAKELRPFVEKLVTLARSAAAHESAAAEFESDAEKGTDEWKTWRSSDKWQQWSQQIAPAVALRRRAFSMLRDKDAVSILFDELAERFADRPGGYTRIVKLPNVRLGDAGAQALIEFVGERDRVKSAKRAAPVVEDEPTPVAETSEPAESEASAEKTEE